MCLVLDFKYIQWTILKYRKVTICGGEIMLTRLERNGNVHVVVHNIKTKSTSVKIINFEMCYNGK
jgi:hypothetical protein